MIWVGHVARRTLKNTYNIPVGKPQRKKPLGISGRVRRDNITKTMD
jgi:hypothetical protein